MLRPLLCLSSQSEYFVELFTRDGYYIGQFRLALGNRPCFIKENRTFDNYFGTYPGANGATTALDSEGETIPLQHGQDQVVRKGRDDAEQFGQQPDDDETVVVVIDVAAGQPRIIGREGRALEDRVEVREIHRLLAALPGMPQIGVAPADKQIQREERNDDRLDCKQVTPIVPQIIRQRVPMNHDLTMRN